MANARLGVQPRNVRVSHATIRRSVRGLQAEIAGCSISSCSESVGEMAAISCGIEECVEDRETS